MTLSPYNDPYLKSCLKIFRLDGTVVPWEMNKFPDGQLQVKIKKEDLTAYDGLTVYASLFNSAAVDLFFQCIDTWIPDKIKINYLYGARSDKNESGDYYVSNTADLTCHRIYEENFNADDVEFLAPHCFEYCQNIGVINFDLPDCVNLDDYDLIIYPDESAQKRYTSVNKPYIICEKHRDQETGKILSHVIPNLPDGVKRVIVIDDCCDAGSTFKNVGEVLPKNVKADLFIFHGIFTNCAPLKLFEYYENIFVSNSLPHVQQMAYDFTLWKNHKINYKTFTEQYGIEHFTQYKDFVPGNLIVFDVWGLP
jgi:hypoxanthine phosphoribosyltransferase